MAFVQPIPLASVAAKDQLLAILIWIHQNDLVRGCCRTVNKCWRLMTVAWMLRSSLHALCAATRSRSVQSLDFTLPSASGSSTSPSALFSHSCHIASYSSMQPCCWHVQMYRVLACIHTGDSCTSLTIMVSHSCSTHCR